MELIDHYSAPDLHGRHGLRRQVALRSPRVTDRNIIVIQPGDITKDCTTTFSLDAIQPNEVSMAYPRRNLTNPKMWVAYSPKLINIKNR